MRRRCSEDRRRFGHRAIVTIHPLKEDEERLAPECSNYEKFLIDTATHTAQGLTASKILLINPLTLRPSG